MYLDDILHWFCTNHTLQYKQVFEIEMKTQF